MQPTGLDLVYSAMEDEMSNQRPGGVLPGSNKKQPWSVGSIPTAVGTPIDSDAQPGPLHDSGRRDVLPIADRPAAQTWPGLRRHASATDAAQLPPVCAGYADLVSEGGKRVSVEKVSADGFRVRLTVYAGQESPPRRAFLPQLIGGALCTNSEHEREGEIS